MAPKFLQPHFFQENYILPEPKFPLLSKHHVSSYIVRAFAHSCSICVYLIYKRNSSSAFKNSARKSFPMKALTTFPRESVTISSKPVHTSITT